MFACIYTPDFPVQAALLPEPAETRAALNCCPVAILDGPASLPRVFAANRAAWRAGIQIGMTKLQAEICAGIELRKRSLVIEDSAQSALLDCAAAFSPRVESTAPGAVILDLSGTEKLFAKQPLVKQKGGPLGGIRASGIQTGPLQASHSRDIWPAAARVITAKAAEAGFHTQIAIAANPDTAFLAARGFSTNTVIPSGEESQHLASLPVATLPLSPEMLATLASWGIRTFQSLAALPSVAIVERLGQHGLYIQKLACGAVSRPLLTFEPESEFAASFEFEDPVETLESVFFILNHLLHSLCTRLLSTAQAASELRLTIQVNVRQLAIAILSEPPGQSKDLFEHFWKLPVPTQDKNLLFGLIHLHLQNVTFSAPVRSLRLEIVPVKPRLAQGNLFSPPSPEPEKMEITLERIRGVVGATDTDGIYCAGSPLLLDTHKPGAFILQAFSSIEDTEPQTPFALKNFSSKKTQQSSSAHPRAPRGSGFSWPPNKVFAPGNTTADIKSSFKNSPLTAFRVFRPAIETAVELDGITPHFVQLWNRPRRVLSASGPWTTSGNWWNVAAWMREEWEVTLQTSAGMGLYRIYRDCLQNRWFLEGMVD